MPAAGRAQNGIVRRIFRPPSRSPHVQVRFARIAGGGQVTFNLFTISGSNFNSLIISARALSTSSLQSETAQDERVRTHTKCNQTHTRRTPNARNPAA